jgi:two-component system sensor histidine kinase HydH
MITRLAFLKFVAPLLGTSLLLAALAGTAAWYVQRQQSTASDVIAREVHSMVAIHNLYIIIREVRYQLNQYLRLGDEVYLRDVVGLENRANDLLRESKSLAQSPDQLAQLQRVEDGYRQFVNELSAAKELPAEERKPVLDQWANTLINELILNPAQECVLTNQQIVDRTNELNRQSANRLTQVFLFLGLTGSVAGMLMGLTIARSLQRSLRELHGFVAGAAGKLERLEEPFPAPPTGELIDLRMGAKFLERRATQVVEQLAQREHEVLRNEQLAAVGQLAAGLAHELRNPLMPMKMLVQSARSAEDQKGLHGRSLQILEEEISRMESSIQAFLDFARPPVLEKRRTPLRPIVEGAIDLVAGKAAEQEITIQAEFPTPPCELELDPTQIKQVVLNLVLNAMDELSPRGRIDIEVAPGTPLVEASNEENASQRNGVRLIVSDNGPGIPDEVLPKIFEPFVTRKELGTGLGLTICRRIIEAHGGQITAANSAFGGAEFCVWLPAAAPAAMLESDTSRKEH